MEGGGEQGETKKPSTFNSNFLTYFFLKSTKIECNSSIKPSIHIMSTKMSTLSTFASWSTKYKTWADLKAWLQASEPTVEILEFANTPYVILKAGKDTSTIAATGAAQQAEAAIAEDSVSEAAQLCRSLVWDTQANRPCCIAPFAARRDQKIPLTGEALRMEDFVEGVMINIFRV